ncbi:MAG: hypothetical protein JNM79_21185 [Burkholderiales bacterium]|nr:hypothetical protein [Burkholderiales bacterium]
MPAFELVAMSRTDGSFAAAWFDDEACVWDDARLSQPTPVLGEWEAPRLRLRRPEFGATAVLFNPNAYAVSQGARDELSHYAELEFLPVRIEGRGVYYLLHVTAAVELPEGSSARVAEPPSGNIVQIHSFPAAYEPSTAFFRVLQPQGSAARRVGATVRQVYVSSIGAKAVASVAGNYLVARELRGA